MSMLNLTQKQIDHIWSVLEKEHPYISDAVDEPETSLWEFCYGTADMIEATRTFRGEYYILYSSNVLLFILAMEGEL